MADASREQLGDAEELDTVSGVIGDMCRVGPLALPAAVGAKAALGLVIVAAVAVRHWIRLYPADKPGSPFAP